MENIRGEVIICKRKNGSQGSISVLLGMMDKLIPLTNEPAPSLGQN